MIQLPPLHDKDIKYVRGDEYIGHQKCHSFSSLAATVFVYGGKVRVQVQELTTTATKTTLKCKNTVTENSVGS